jgi:8-oxo-dGTP diphosphatase
MAIRKRHEVKQVYLSGPGKNMQSDQQDFMGAKLALFVGDRLVVIKRDDIPGLLWPDHWDMPGGGREDNETPLQCVQRETREELNLIVPDSQITWARAYTNSIGRTVWFMAAWLPEHAARDMQLGHEGQKIKRFSIQEYCGAEKAVPQFVDRLRDYALGVPSQRDVLRQAVRKTPRT